MRKRAITAWRIGAAMPAMLLSACGGSDGGGGVASTPTQTAAAAPTPAPTPAPAPAPTVNYDTAEYRRSNAAVQAQAITAYNNAATGAGIVVGVIDSGVNAASPEFAGRISSASADFAGSRGISDEGGHGTAVSSVLLGARNDAGTQGVAFDATLLVLRTDTPGSCSTNSTGTIGGGCSHNDNTIAVALDVAVNARARVVNVSLGGAPPNNLLRAAIDRATAAGLILVISGGNEGVTNPTMAANPDMLSQVANDPISRGLVIIAGATDATGAIADFSNKAGNNATHYLAALGSRVRGIDNNGASMLFSGTSFSAPVISGAVALLAQAFPSLTSAQIVALLYRTANDGGAPGVDAIYGNGELNIARAFSPVGSLALSGSQVPVSLSTNATLGSAMGDAGQGGLSATIRDEFDRNFAVDLTPTIGRVPTANLLAPALAQDMRTMTAAGGRTAYALSITPRDNNDPRRLLLSSVDANRARVLAGAMSVRIDKTLRLGLAAGRSADGLTAPGDGFSAPAFLIGDRGLDRAPQAAFALRKTLGGIGLTFNAESGAMRLWRQGAAGISSDAWHSYGYTSAGVAADAASGPMTIRLGITRLRERSTIIGSRFDAALGGGGAVSVFADAALNLRPGNDWRLAATWRQGWTRPDTGAVRGASLLTSRALSAEVARQNVWSTGDSLAVRYLEPLRVTSGALSLLYAGAPQSLALAPSGHERDWEAAYARPVGRGWLSANGFVRIQPGNWRTAPTDIGGAVRYSVEF